MLFDHCAAYSFGKIPKGGKALYESSISPGPGQYSPNSNYIKESIKGFKMCGNDRNYNKKPMTSDCTGVGKYQIPSNFGEGPKYSMKGISGTDNPCANNCSPGPGAYNPMNTKKGPAYSLGGRLNKQEESAKNPGVGQYDIRTDKSLQVPSTRFGDEPKGSLANMNNPSNFLKWNDEPSPGNYSPNANYVKTTYPKYSFGTDKRFNGTKATCPSEIGPGSYKFKPAFGNEGRATSMGAIPYKSTLKDCYTTPGPGAYNSTMYHKPNIKGFKMGSSPRDMENLAIKHNYPGPGNDGSSLKKLLDKSPKWGMGTGTDTMQNPNIPFNNNSISPGPGKYNTRQKIGEGGPKYSLGPKDKYPDTKWKESIPGPHEYYSNMNTLKKNPKWKFGSEMRGNSSRAGYKNENPGPADYNICKSFEAPSYRFDKSNRLGLKTSNIVGPGFYKIPCSIVDVNNYTRDSGKFDPNFRYV